MNKLLCTERLDLFEPNIYIGFLVQLTGSAAPDAVVSAVKTAFAANEAILSKVVLNANGDAYYEKMSQSGCTVTVCNDDWREILRCNEKIPFSIDKGELIRVFVITSNNELSLLIMAHHLAGDGKAVTYFLEDIMTALSGVRLDYKPMRLITTGFLPEGTKLPLIFKWYAAFYNRKWKRSGRIFNWNNYADIHHAYWHSHESRIVFERFSPEELGDIRAYAKRIGATVNSYITTAFLQANRKSGTIGIAVSVRENNDKSMSNQVAGINVDHAYDSNAAFEENVCHVHKKVQCKLANPVMKYFVLRFIPLFNPGLIDSVLMSAYGLYDNKTSHKLAKVMGYVGSKKRELGITNLTKLDIPDTYGPYGIKHGLFIAPVVSYARRIIGVSTMNDGMTVSYHFMSDQDKDMELAFFERAVRIMKEACVH